MLPGHIAERLKRDPSVIADGLADCTVMFADLTDFTRLTEELPPRDMVAMLNEVFSWFDVLAEKYGLEKIKTIGDAYMVAGGLLDHDARVHRGDRRTWRSRCATRSPSCKTPRRRARSASTSASARGPVVAGVIGVKKFIYDLWGNTVNHREPPDLGGDHGRHPGRRHHLSPPARTVSSSRAPNR